MKKLQIKNESLIRAVSALLIFIIYFATALPFAHWTGKWPAPYWLSVSLGVFLIYVCVGNRLSQIAWIIPMSILGFVIVWFFEFGIYHLSIQKWLAHHAPWYFHREWVRITPIAVFLAMVMFFSMQGKLRFLMSLFFAEFLLLILISGNAAIDGYLTKNGNFNVDTYGFGMGTNFLIAIVVSFFMAKALFLLINKIEKCSIVRRKSAD